MVCCKKVDDCLDSMKVSVLIDIDATNLLFDENGNPTINLNYCESHAAFEHTDPEVTEYILHIGSNSGFDTEDKIEEMEVFGCTPEFVEVYKEAVKRGAWRLMLHS